MQLTQEQKDVLLGILEFKKKVTVLAGVAGSGKSTLVKHLNQILNNWAFCAYTGKAVDVLRSKGVKDATTIHALIYKPVMDDAGNILKDKSGNPLFDKTPSLDCEGIIVDEASMVNKEIYEHLISYNIPIIFAGDHGQLPPIGGEDFNIMSKPDFKLETIHRNAGEIAHFCNYIRQGYRPASYEKYKPKSIEFISKAEAYARLLEPSQIICAYNKTRVEINKRVRDMLGYTELLHEDERIMCLKNNSKIGIFNGMQGTVKKISGKFKNKIIFDTGEQDIEVFYDGKIFGQEKPEISFGEDSSEAFDYAYCCTAHKSQGSEWDSGMVFEQFCKMWDNTRWAYTAGSRFKTKLIWVS